MVSFKVVSTLIALYALGSANASLTKPNSLVLKASLKPVLDIRGGAALDTESVAKVAIAVSVIHGGLNYLAPDATSEVYGAKKSPLERLLMRRIGLTVFNLGLITWAALFGGISTETALSLPCLTFAIENIRASASRVDSSIIKPSMILFAYILSWVFVFALNSEDLATRAAKVVALSFLLDATTLVFGGKKTAEGWCNKGVVPGPTELALVQDLGLWLATIVVFMVSLVFGEFDVMEAFKYSRLAVLARTLVINFVAKDVGAAYSKKAEQKFWLAYHILIVAALFMS